jgi:hypothetical protein
VRRFVLAGVLAIAVILIILPSAAGGPRFFTGSEGDGGQL